jgi:hypothetical protein
MAACNSSGRSVGIPDASRGTGDTTGIRTTTATTATSATAITTVSTTATATTVVTASQTDSGTGTGGGTGAGDAAGATGRDAGTADMAGGGAGGATGRDAAEADGPRDSAIAGAGGFAGPGGAGGTGGATGRDAGTADMAGGGAGGATGGAGTSGSAGAAGSSVPPGTCEVGSSSTTWASNCPTSAPSCTAGTWTAGGPDPDHSTFTLVSESAHFAIYSDEAISSATAQSALDTLENVIWKAYFGAPIFFKEPLCNLSSKTKASIHVHSDYGLTGGAWTATRMGMWIGPGALADHWGLAHEFMHAVQSVSGGQSCNQSNTCGWIYESHANFMPHQLPEYANNVHCSEMLFNAPHLYMGSTRDRYCNWQFMEYLKDKYCYSPVNAIWTGTPVNNPFTAIMNTTGWNISQLNDFMGEWAMHNVTWDYKVSGAAFRSSYAAITDKSLPERRLRLTQLEPLDSDWAGNRRFQSPSLWAPQRWGYNVVRLLPESGATSVGVTFRGVTQSAANSDWRWGLVAVNGATARYSSMQRGSDAAVSLCINSGESVYLAVMATPSVYQSVVWDQAYSTIYRFPYMVQLTGAWPESFPAGTQAACPAGTSRVANGGGCGPSSLPATVYVGPYAQVLGGTVSGNARIDDHAIVLTGTVSDGTVSGLSIIGNFGVSGTAKAQTTFYPLGFFESGQAISGSTALVGDVEYRGQGYNRSSGTCSGFVDSATCLAPGTEVTAAPPFTWRP